MATRLGQALKEKKGERSLRAVARDLNVSPGTIEGWINGWRAPDLKHIPMLADYLGVSVGDIVEWGIEVLDAKGGYVSSDAAEIPVSPVAA